MAIPPIIPVIVPIVAAIAIGYLLTRGSRRVRIQAASEA
jgi:hypothetical protein